MKRNERTGKSVAGEAGRWLERMANAREVMVEITGKDRWIWGVTMRGAALRAFKSVFASALSQTADKAKRKRAAALPPRDRDSRRR